ncbi:hypothetical protein GobsT_51320 [Gemmata obscuriglobus]|uniref:Phage ABA sandwich domain-containing protein n=1 Tax=Gemmata obscuriglobus TaxID=114 RepID=A0A2Z3H068_9BACT|nr:hypothetical protein [Gemmata obscuriglobus]AWM36986.1 hypothetical protein C1280_08100 [Gemmata obscuriglobus]QEG30327.1 hypothetical protein GobsT_51320 [Gemmata obscuriglobus]VTS09651.1 unnamed protein product [Gemmata obscuriglobus UQM 2246]
MTPLAQTALDFARECLKWRKAEFSGTSHTELMWFNAPGGIRFLRFGDLSAVMSAVREWCDRTGCRIEMHYSPDQNGFGVLCEGVDTWDADPCHALLEACVEASRKLKIA